MLYYEQMEWAHYLAVEVLYYSSSYRLVPQVRIYLLECIVLKPPVTPSTLGFVVIHQDIPP